MKDVRTAKHQRRSTERTGQTSVRCPQCGETKVTLNVVAGVFYCMTCGERFA